MAEKIEIEKPVISKELAEAFEEKRKYKDDYFVLTIVNLIAYSQDLPERKYMEDSEFNELLIDMYAIGYEIEKPKHYVLELPVENAGKVTGYVCKTLDEEPRYRFIGIGWLNYSDGFTKEEIEADEGLNKLASVCELVEVED